MAKTYYAVTTDATVYRCSSLKEAGSVEGAIIATDANMTDLPTALLVKLYNRARPERPVTRFADRPTALKRLEGVLDLLARPLPSHTTTPEPAPKGKRQPKAERPTEEPKKRGAKPKDIAPETVQTVMAMRAEGKGWPEIIAALGEAQNFVHRVRKVMKELDPTSVKPLGPGSPNYGKGPQPRPKREPGAPRERKPRARKGNGVPVEAF